ncbi:hypothetical protein [Pseudomonas phoenicis]|uniref:hypothetical protein n=1 Tax=unclassified Pseudomonas TaxID=196821 RepID=UPI0039A1EEDD
MNKTDPISPLSLIAIFAGIIEASALASLPFLSRESQYIYTWFLVGFPFFLTVLFFLTLNFNYRSLWKPAYRPIPPTVVPMAPDLLPFALAEPPLTLALSGNDTPRQIEQRLLQAISQELEHERAWVIFDLEKRRRVCLVLSPDKVPPGY